MPNIDIEHILNEFLQSPEQMLAAGIGLSVLLLFAGVSSLIKERNPAASRIASINSRASARRDRGLLKSAELDPRGMMRHFVPATDGERSALRQKLLRAGIANPNAMHNYTLFRVVFGILLPCLLLGLLFLSRLPQFPIPELIVSSLGKLTNFHIFQIITVMVAIGYYLPAMWLSSRISERTRLLEEGFPNALDLLQISLEAGLGFDSAMTRVGNELAPVSPSIATEFLTVQRQVQAGRGRDQALKDMADRTGLETVRSFANVVNQAVQFGTPMNEALMKYANEMREYREMKAQEMANKLPVKMSAVLASLMLPALILITIGPTVIRFARAFG